MKKTCCTLLALLMMAMLCLSGCGSKDKASDGTDTAQSSAGGAGTADNGAETQENGSGTVAADEKPAKITGHYDLWAYESGAGEYTAEVSHEDMEIGGFVFLEEDHTGKMGQSASGTETANYDITWDDDGNISVFGNSLYTFAVKGDVLEVDMSGGVVKYYYVREGVDGEVAYHDFRQSEATGGTAVAADDSAGSGSGGAASGKEDNDDSLLVTVPAGTRYKVCAIDEDGNRDTGNAVKDYEKSYLTLRSGGEIDFDLGTSDLSDGEYYLDETYGAITKYTDIEEPLYPYGFAADGDVLFVKVKRDTLVLARDDVDASDALNRVGDTPLLKVRDVDRTNTLTGYAPTPRDIEYKQVGGSIYFDPVSGTIKYIEPTVTEIDYPRGFNGIGIFNIKPGVYDAQALKIFHCAPDMFPADYDPATGEYSQNIFTSSAGFLLCNYGFCGKGAIGKMMFCHHGTAASDYLGNIETMEYGPAFINANLADGKKLLGSHSKNAKDYKLISGKDAEIKALTEFVVDNDTDASRIIERIGKFVNADYLYDYDSGRYDTKYVDTEWVEKKNALQKTLIKRQVLNEGRAYLMRDMCIAAGVPCMTVIMGTTPVDCSVYESYEDYYEDHHEEFIKSKHADDYADEEIPDYVQEALDADRNSAHESEVFNFAYADGKWHMIDGTGVVGLDKNVGPNGLFMRFQILEVDGEKFDHVDRQEYIKEVYEAQQAYTKAAIAKGELPDWSAFDHVLDDSGTYRLYDGIDTGGKVTLPEDTLGKKDAWVRLDMDGTGELEWYGFHSNLVWSSNTGSVNHGSETRDTTGTRWDGKSREHGISNHILYIRDGEYVEQKFEVLEPYGVSMMLYDTNNLEEDGYRYRFLKDTGETPGSYGKSVWK